MIKKEEIYNFYRKEWMKKLGKREKIVTVPALSFEPGKLPEPILVDVIIEEPETVCKNKA